MSAPGWYPDPAGDPHRIRYWTGSAWSGESQPRGGASRSLPTATPPPRRRRWLALLAVVVVAGLAIGFLLWPRTAPPAGEDQRTARPTGSVWDEVGRSASPDPSTPEPTAGQDVACPGVEDVRSSGSAEGIVVGGNLSFPVPEGWVHPHSRISRVLTDQDTAIRPAEGSTWTSLLVAGVAPRTAGFKEPRATANQIIECHITSANFPGLTGKEVELNEAVTVDGVTGWRVRAHARTPRAPGGGAVFEVVVVDAGHPGGLSAFWGGVVYADEQAMADLAGAIEALRVEE